MKKTQEIFFSQGVNKFFVFQNLFFTDFRHNKFMKFRYVIFHKKL
jgi:hypothetical protein